MIRLNLRLRRNFLIVWSLCLWAVFAIFPPAYQNYYPTPADRQSFLMGMQQNAGMVALWGPLEDPPTLGQIVLWEAGSMMIILGSVMAVLLFVGLHRKSEALGLTELQLSTGIPRMAPAAAAMATTVIAALIVGTGSAGVLWLSSLYVDEMPLRGAWSSGAVITLTMIGSALLAHLVLLFVDNPASVTRIGLMTVAVSFIARAVADSEELDWLNWIAPLGWKTVVHPYVRDDWAAIAILAGVCAVAAGLLLWAERYREYGRALVPLPTRSSTRTRRIRGPVHLASVLHRGTILTWAVVIAALSAFIIALTGSLSEWMETEENVGQIFKEIFGDGDMKAEFIAYTAKLCGILVATYGIQVIVSYRAGELDRTVDLQRSTGLRRWVPLGSATLVSAVGVLLGVLAILAGGAFGLWTQDATTATDYDNLVPAAWSQLAPALLLTAVTVVLVGWAPRFTHVAWAPVVAAAVLTLFGPILSAPQWMIDLSPFEYAVSSTQGSWTTQLGMGLGAAVLIGCGLWGSRRREIR